MNRNGRGETTEDLLRRSVVWARICAWDGNHGSIVSLLNNAWQEESSRTRDCSRPETPASLVSDAALLLPLPISIRLGLEALSRASQDWSGRYQACGVVWSSCSARKEKRCWLKMLARARTGKGC